MDNNKIFEKTKMKIAISNVKEEDIVMDKRKLNIVKGIGIAACITLSMTGVVFATTQIINKFGANSSDGIQTAIENGYYSDINTEYKEANGISTSIEAFLIDNDNFDINFNIKFDDSYSLHDMLANDGKIDIMDLKVVNEKNEKVFATRELETEEMTSLYKTEQEARDNYTSYNGSYSETTQKINDNEIKYYLTATGNPVEFPTSQKLKVTFNKIRNSYWEKGKEKYRVYEGEWSYEIDVSSKMAKSNIVQYKLVSISDESYKFDSARVSNTAFKIIFGEEHLINQFSDNASFRYFSIFHILQIFFRYFNKILHIEASIKQISIVYHVVYIDNSSFGIIYHCSQLITSKTIWYSIFIIFTCCDFFFRVYRQINIVSSL